MSTSASQVGREFYEFGPFKVDCEKEILLRAGEPVALTPKTFQILLVLIRHSKEVVTKDDLMKAVWSNTFVEEGNLSRNIFMLRKALGESPQDHQYVLTVPGRGYRFAENVRLVSEGEVRVVAAKHSVLQVQIEETSRRKWMALAAIFLTAAVVGVPWILLHRAPVLTEKDTVVLADFTNTTGDSVFDGTLKKGLAVDLEQSPFLNIYSDARVQQTLKLMGRAPNTRVTSEIGREVCQRDGLKAVIAGSIARLGSEYVITLEAVDGSTGDTLAETEADALRKEQVLNALGSAATGLRAKLGESLNSIQKFNMPLAEATTSSLTALKAFTLGDGVFISGHEIRAVPFYEHAIELDPNFVLAYARIGTIYANYGEKTLMGRYEKRAFALRGRASEREKLYITGHYYSDGGQIEKGIEAWELYKQTYPQDHMPWVNLANQYNQLGEFHRALENGCQAMRLAPESWNCNLNCAIAYAGLNRLDEAKAVLDDALKHKLETQLVHYYLSQIALAEGDNAAREREDALAGSTPLRQAMLNFRDARLASSRGQLWRASNLFKRAQTLAQQVSLSESAADWVAAKASIEALFGEPSQAIEDAKAAMAIGLSSEVKLSAATALALAGKDVEAELLAREVARSRPLDTRVESVRVPDINAIIEMNRGQASEAIDLLEAARPYDGADTETHFLRGEAYLKANRARNAEQEFQKIMKLRDFAPDDPLISLARLGLARADVVQGKRADARAQYREFFTLWQKADPNLPILKQVKREYTRLK